MGKFAIYFSILLLVTGFVLPVRSQSTTKVESCLNGYRILSPSTELNTFLKLWIDSSAEPIGRLVFKGPGNDDSSNGPTSRYLSFEFKTSSLHKLDKQVAVQFSTRVVDSDSYVFSGNCKKDTIKGKLSKFKSAKKVWSRKVTFKAEWIVE